MKTARWIPVALLALCAPAQADQIVSTVSQLGSAISSANSGGDPVIVIQDGTYTLTSQYGYLISGDGITIRSQSGNREAVILEGQGIMNSAVTHIFQVTGDDCTIQDMTLRKVRSHSVQVHGENPHSGDGFTIRNVIIQDCGEQLLKVSARDGEGSSADDGLVEGCLFEYTAGIGPQYYIGGVDAHTSNDWIVRDNEFRSIRSPDSNVAEYAIHFWSGSTNIVVERNRIINCDRGIGFGLGSRGTSGGVIQNNMIYHASLGGSEDIGIGLETATDVKVYHNTVFQEHSFPGAISVRFATSTGVEFKNNLIYANGAWPIWFRDGATAVTAGNVTNAQSGWFTNTSAGDLHLKDGSVSAAIDQAVAIPGFNDDFDEDARPNGAAMDVGADEFHGASSGVESRSWGQVKSQFRG